MSTGIVPGCNCWRCFEFGDHTAGRTIPTERVSTVEWIRAELKRYGYDPLWPDMTEILNRAVDRPASPVKEGPS